MVCLASLGMVFLGAYAQADGLGEQTKNYGDALERANQYSFDTGGIGIIMSYGAKNGVTADAIGEAFVNEIKKRGFPSKYYFYPTTHDGVALSFRIGYLSMGPWGTDEAASNVSKAISMAKAAQRVHNNSDDVLRCADEKDVRACLDKIKTTD